MYNNHMNATQDQITELKSALKDKHLSPYYKMDLSGRFTLSKVDLQGCF